MLVVVVKERGLYVRVYSPDRLAVEREDRDIVLQGDSGTTPESYNR